MAKWFYLVDGQEVGPLEAGELKQFADSGRLSPDQKVRRADSTQWHDANQVKGLFFTDETQGGSSLNVMPKAKSNEANATEKSFQSRKRGRTLRKKVVLTALVFPIIAAVYACWTIFGDKHAVSDVAAEQTSPQVQQSTVALPDDVSPRPDLAVRATPAPPQYTIVKTEDVSMGAICRLQVRVSIPKHYSRGAVNQVANAIVADTTATKPVNAISILFYGPDASTTGPYDIAMVEWAPNGRWGDANQVEAGEYSTFAYSVEYKEPAPQPEHSLEASGMSGLLGTPLPKGSRLIEQRPGDPAAGRDPSERYTVPASAVQISAFFSREMPAAGWAKDGSSTKTTLFYQKGNQMIGVMINGAGGTFTLMGS